LLDQHRALHALAYAGARDRNGQETLLSLTNRATHLCNRNGVDHLAKTFFPIYVTMPILVVLRYKGGRHKYKITPEIGEPLELLSLGMRGVGDQRYTPLPRVLSRKIS